MKIKFYILFLLPFLVDAQQVIHLERDLGSSYYSVDNKLMTKRIKEAANKYNQYKPVPRFAQFDYAFGSDIKEHIELNRNGILFITSLNQDEKEYPIKKVYFKGLNLKIDLELITSITLNNKDKEIVEVFGKNRRDYYFLIPYYITQLEGELLIDWTINRSDFRICSFPNNQPLDFDKEKNIEPEKNKKIKIEVLKEFLKREYNIMTIK